MKLSATARLAAALVAMATAAAACTGDIAGAGARPGGHAAPPPAGAGSTGGAGDPGTKPVPLPPDEGGAPVAHPATGQRLTDRQYLNVVADVFGVDASTEAAALPLDSKLEGFRNAAAALLPSDLRIEGYAALASAVAAKVDWAKMLPASGCADFAESCQRAFVDGLGRRLFRRPLTDEQRQRFDALFALVKKEGDAFPVAAGLAARAMLQSPEMLYRLEHDGDSVDAFELGTRLSFLLWNSAPDDALLDAAAGGQLATEAGLQAQATRLLADPRARRALRDYVDDWLDADKLPRTNRDADRFPQWSRALAADMREEVHRLFERVVWRDRGDLMDVLRSETTEVTPALAKLYGLPAPADGFHEVSLRGAPARFGLLTQAGVLTVTSVGGAGSSIVDRGVFLLRNLLCRHLPEPPNNVPELPPADAGKSERDRLAQHRAAPTCAACHAQIDPLGLAFETYDAIGGFQSMDAQGNKLTGAGTLDLGDKEVPYTDVRSFVGGLLAAPEVESCLVRKVVQYGFARPLEQADEALVTRLAKSFHDGGRRYPELLAALAGSAALRAAGVSP